VGDLNVILGAPHGGGQTPSNIPDRDAGCLVSGECVYSHSCGNKNPSQCGVTTVRDSFTLELTELIADELEAMTGRRPTTSINLLHRRKLDANREINEATFGEPDSVAAWEEFNRCINESKVAIEAEYPVGGLFFDIHGHGHPNDWAELGYLISGANLDSGNFEASQTSIYRLSTETDHDFESLLRGDTSFGKFLEDEGFESVPSPTHDGPSGQSYFSGGYNTRIHGSRDGGRVDAIQIESAYVNRDAPMREAYARGLAAAMVNYMTAHGMI
jgi:hypothetical protein